MTNCIAWSAESYDVDQDLETYAPGPGKLGDRQFDPVTFNVLKVNADHIASQLTLGDLPVFKAIKPEELTSCAWNGRNKLQVAPNVVAFIRRFNHVCLWCQKEVLNCESLKRRIDVIGHFIKIAKKLLELNNIHSAFAIISGLRSNAIYRLRRTWATLPNKDKLAYERLEKLFSDRNNWERLRKYMQSVKLPCIPYLGLYLTDLVYIDVAHPSSGGLESSQRKNLMNNILRVLADLQSSEYDNLLSIDYFQKYLDTIRYIDELQKFVEEDLYNLSLRLEPNPSVVGSGGRTADTTNVNTPTLLPVVQTVESSLQSVSLTMSPQLITLNERRQQKQSCWQVAAVRGHRKTQSLGSNSVRFKSDKRLSGNDTFPLVINSRRHLLDDSVLECSSCAVSTSSLPQVCQNDAVGDSGNETSDETVWKDGHPSSGGGVDKKILATVGLLSRSISVLQEGCTIEGAVKRKTLLKWGRRPRIAVWRRLWVRLVDHTLFIHDYRHVPGSGQLRSAYKAHAGKVLSLYGWMVVKGDDPFVPDWFLLQEPAQGHVYRFRVGNQALALQWVEHLKKACEDENGRKPPSNLMTFD